MKEKKALICWGGWNGHTPEATANTLAEALRNKGFGVEVQNSLQPFADGEALKRLDLVIPVWTMGELPKESWAGLNAAVRSGVGFAGVHGGAGDAFRGSIEYQWMVGGQFVGHPYVGTYTVRLTKNRSPITKGMKARFNYNSEQYYMIVDPGVRTLAESTYAYEGKRVTMPAVWTKSWGEGRVFFSALGHVAEEFKQYPDVLAMTTRGMLWAAR